MTHFLVAALVGIACAVQGLLNSTLSERIGNPATVFYTALIGLAPVTIYWLVAARGEASGEATPAWMYVGGICGAFIIFGITYAFTGMTAGAATCTIVAAQIVAAMVADHFGFLREAKPVTAMQIVGALLLVGGTLLVVWPSLTAEAAA